MIECSAVPIFPAMSSFVLSVATLTKAKTRHHPLYSLPQWLLFGYLCVTTTCFVFRENIAAQRSCFTGEVLKTCLCNHLKESFQREYTDVFEWSFVATVKCTVYALFFLKTSVLLFAGVEYQILLSFMTFEQVVLLVLVTVKYILLQQSIFAAYSDAYINAVLILCISNRSFVVHKHTH